MLEDYQKARRLGQREVQRDVAEGHYPYPPALDDILKNEGYQGEVPIGVTEIDVALVAGTKTRGRQNSFSSGFMPLPETTSEFAAKWSALIDSQRDEGIHEPIVAYEYLQRFYVQEGNKRVSVSRYLGTPTVLARVTRIVPMPSDAQDLRVYREFVRFYGVAPIYGLIFSREGSYAELAELAGQDLEHAWPDERVQAVRSSFEAFSAAFRRRGGGSLGLDVGDAYLVYLRIYGLDATLSWPSRQVGEMVARIWGELVVSSGHGAIDYLESPAPARSRIIPQVKAIAKELALAHPFRVAFIYDKAPATSGWVALHERGRHELERRLGPNVETIALADRADDASFARAVDAAAADEADLVVTVAPTQMERSLRAAVTHPDLAFLNCSVSLSHDAVRTFSARLYEAKFLLGALAASMADNHRVGYVARTPVFGSVAEVNAFALGASMVDPHATVFLKWFSAKDYDWRRELAEAGVRVVSARDYPNPVEPNETWGLYLVDEGGAHHRVAEPVWNWGRYYELIVRSIRNDSWRREADERRNRALNYWWGMSAGVVDVRLSERLPQGQRVLVDVLRQSILSGRVTPFAGELRSQDGIVQPRGSDRLPSEQIARMRWLNENVVGRLPEQRELSSPALREVRVSGLIPLDPTPGGDPAGPAGTARAVGGTTVGAPLATCAAGTANPPGRQGAGTEGGAS